MNEGRFIAGSIKSGQFSDLDIPGIWPSSGKTGKEQRPWVYDSNCSCIYEDITYLSSRDPQRPAIHAEALAGILFWSLEMVSSTDPRKAYQAFSLESSSSSNPSSLYSFLEAGSCSALCVCVEETWQIRAMNWMKLGWICPRIVLSRPFLCKVPLRKYF